MVFSPHSPQGQNVTIVDSIVDLLRPEVSTIPRIWESAAHINMDIATRYGVGAVCVRKDHDDNTPRTPAEIAEILLGTIRRDMPIFLKARPQRGELRTP